MPPPINSQGSRGGLITAVVIFAILFVTATIFAIYFQVNYRDVEDQRVKFERKYKAVISDTDLSTESEIAQAVKEMESDPTGGDANTKWVVRLKARGDNLAKMIAGGNAPGITAADQAVAKANAINEALKKGGISNVTIGQDNLLGSLDRLANELIARQKAYQTDLDKYKAEMVAAKADVETAQSRLAGIQKQIDDATANRDKAMADASADRSKKQGQVDTITADTKKMVEDLQKQIQDKQVEVTAGTTKIAQLDKLIENLKARLARGRVNTADPIVRRSDGTISRVSASGDIVFIDRGQGDQIFAGMTFEVFDRLEGVPPLGDGMREEDMPVGKGSIEVIRVGATTSECRMIKQTPGMQITQGDLIANLIYDPNVKYNFLVYGKFDLDHNKVSTDADAEVLKRLVTQWGGKVMDKVSVDTDFVVLGSEPTLPTFQGEEANDPVNADRLAKAKAELDAYNQVRADARDLHIPVMNQNRFLYLIGYYGQSQR